MKINTSQYFQFIGLQQIKIGQLFQELLRSEECILSIGNIHVETACIDKV